MANTLTIKISKESVNMMDCSALQNLIGLFQWACTVRGDKNACKQLEYLRAIAQSKGCSI